MPPPPVYHPVLPNAILLCKTQCSPARPCTSSPLSAACVLSVQNGWGMKGKGLGELKGGGTREGKAEFALSHNFYKRVFWVQLRVLGDTDTAETDSQTDRQTTRKTGDTDVRGIEREMCW